MYKKDSALKNNNNGLYAIKVNQTKLCPGFELHF